MTVSGAVALAFAPVTASAAGNGTSHTPARAQAPVTASLVNGVSGRCVDDPGFVTTDGTQIALWDCNGGANQHWTTSGSGTVTAGGKCLDVAGGPAGAQTPGTRVVLWTCNGSPSQNWTLTGQPAQIRNASGLCLDTAMGVGPNGVPLVVWNCITTSKSQAWTLR
ncbi:RICIN domain-containing protein [Streptomyces sp. NPDC020719]|uniref:RICIN domain-containing protein n=1 Tax=Streptomyces sp. NPDC020719 TaxID=3154896 RepID=UPI0033C24B7E